MLKISNLYFGYSTKYPIFEDVNLEIFPGHIYSLLANNGAGKSSLLYLMCGLLKHYQGRVEFKGIDILKHYPSQMSDLFLVAEEYQLPSITFKKYIQRNRIFYPNFSDEILTDTMNSFEMPLDVHLNELSMGEKKKVYICFALATNTALLLMDEPSNGLDIISKLQFRKAVNRGMTDDKSIVISTHQVKDVETLLDRMLILKDKKLILDTSVDEVLDKLYFTEQGLQQPLEDALYYQPSALGNSVIYANQNHQESILNIELFFNALHLHTESILTNLK